MNERFQLDLKHLHHLIPKVIDEHVETGISRFAGGADEVGALDGTEIRAEEVRVDRLPLPMSRKEERLLPIEVYPPLFHFIGAPREGKVNDVKPGEKSCDDRPADGSIALPGTNHSDGGTESDARLGHGSRGNLGQEYRVHSFQSAA